MFRESNPFHYLKIMINDMSFDRFCLGTLLKRDAERKRVINIARTLPLGSNRVLYNVFLVQQSREYRTRFFSYSFLGSDKSYKYKCDS